MEFGGQREKEEATKTDCDFSQEPKRAMRQGKSSNTHEILCPILVGVDTQKHEKHRRHGGYLH